ncbi:hypothetical protein GCM10020331_057740 [Ectobacillus funiculus]
MKKRSRSRNNPHRQFFRAPLLIFLPKKIIRVFREKYPKLELVLHEGTLEEVNEWLLTRVIDVGIIILPSEEMDTLSLAKDKMVVVLRDDHPLYIKPSISIKDLENEPLIVFKGGDMNLQLSICFIRLKQGFERNLLSRM